MEKKMKLKNYGQLLGVSLTLSCGLLQAENVAYYAVNKNTCSRMQNNTHPFILVLSKGDDLIQSINQCAADAKLPAASVSGIGQVHNPVLAYFTSNPNDKPTLTAFDGYYELASLNGNITNNSNQYYTHLHAALADKNFKGITGHVNSAAIGLTVEITIVPFLGPIERTVDAETDFGPIVTQ